MAKALGSEIRQRLSYALGSESPGNEMANAVDAATVVTEGVLTRVLTQTVTLTNTVKTDLSATIPAGAVIRAVQVNLATLVVGDASGDNGLIKVGLGIVGDPDAYGLTSALTKNLKITRIPAHEVLATATQIAVYAVDTDGAAVTEKFVAGGLVTVRITYDTPIALPNA